MPYKPEEMDTMFKESIRRVLVYKFEQRIDRIDHMLNLDLKDLPEYRSALDALTAYADAIDRRIDEARRTGK